MRIFIPIFQARFKTAFIVVKVVNVKIFSSVETWNPVGNYNIMAFEKFSNFLRTRTKTGHTHR